MRGFVLAAGFGTRLRPLTDHIPKALISVAGKPLLAHSLDFLASSGISSIGVNSHYLHEQLETFRESSHIKFDLFYEKESIRGTGGALYFARDFLGSDNTFCICNVDILFALDLTAIIDRFQGLDCIAALVAVPVPGSGTILYNKETSAYCGVAADRASFPGSAEGAFIGLTLYRKEFLDFLRNDDFSIVPVWARVQEKTDRIKVFTIDPLYWCDIGTPKALAQVHFDTIDNSSGLEIPHTMKIDKERKICIPRAFNPNATIGPWAWIETERVPSDCVVSNSIIFNTATIAPGSVLHNTLVTPWGEVCFGTQN